jgi:predicted kinase
VFVLVGGWPGSGKSTLALALAAELGVACLAKDEVKEALMDGLGAPADVEASQRLGRAAVLALLRLAARCPAAVLDSTWYPYTRIPVEALPGPVVEIRTQVPVEVARARYRTRSAGRHAGHLDAERDDAELWGEPVPPLGAGPLLTVDTTGPVDIPALARAVREAAPEVSPAGCPRPSPRPPRGRGRA